MTVQMPSYKITVEKYNQMIDAGILTKEDKVELINGEILSMSPIGYQHILCLNKLNMLFSKELGDEAIVSIQNPVQMGDYSEPEPDFALLKRPFERYAERKPQVEDVYLIIEVAESTLKFDRQFKKELYARHGVPVCWIVDLNEKKLEVYQKTQDGKYLMEIILGMEDVVLLPEPEKRFRIKDMI